jgi:hypothetical protein
MEVDKSVFSNPHEELAHLRDKVLEAERKLERHGVPKEREEIIKDSITNFTEDFSLSPEHHKEAEVRAEKIVSENIEDKLSTTIKLTEHKGILYALTVVEKMKGWSLEDDYHDFLVDLIRRGLPPKGVKEKGPIYQALHMTLFEIVLPKRSNEEKEKSFKEIISKMEQLYAGLLSVVNESKEETDYLAIEIANPDGQEETNAFVSVPNSRQALFEKQLLSIFPNARIIKRDRDYNIFSKDAYIYGATARLADSHAYPLKTYEDLGDDPLNIILSGFSKIPQHGAGAAIQIIFHPGDKKYAQSYLSSIDKIKKGEKPKEVLDEGSITSELGKVVGTLVFGAKEKKEKIVDEAAIESIQNKLKSPIVETNIRIAVSSDSEAEAKHLLTNIQSAFNQFENSGRNKLIWDNLKATKESDFYRAFTFRLFRESDAVPLNLKELSSILHFHTESLLEGSPLKRMTSKSSGVPSGISGTGTFIGTNHFQGTEKKVYISPEDRLRHLYVVGQTGTGKSTLLKNMIIEDIKAGEGVCMIDPHGSDIMQVLSHIPENRLQDVIYFDPASIDRPMGLNMLEYDRSKPEQKTFVVNELFSIFQKLYGGVPESMGPMFEQYFRNATMLVIEDPDSGSTLLDVSKVLSNREYREMKISRCKNPIVYQFWTEIANKAGGEASLANIVPYITSKFDVFLANDIMRPIIAQEKSAFDFRDIMDNKKILLVNLAKGRLGDINANLIGLIIVGKILMAALSRVDSVGKELPPFYLYIDEFQNITTDSIATILSEARKYKLSLNIAHQFIAQLEENIKDAVFGNVGSLVAFRVGADDAKYLEPQFAPIFTADDLMNIDNLNAYIKILAQGRPVSPFDIQIDFPPPGDNTNVGSIIDLSKQKYGKDREEVETAIMDKYRKKIPEELSALNLK